MASTTEPSAARPLRRDAERNRRRILDAAARVFASRGLGASLDEIAEDAGVGVGTVYRRFPNKDVLIDALFEDQIATVVRLAEEGLALEDPWSGLEHFLRSTIELQARNLGLKELLLGARMSHDSGCTAGARSRIHPLVTRLVDRAKADGSARPDLVATDLPLFQMMVGAVVDYTRDEDPELWQRVVTMLIDGLRASRETHTPTEQAPLDSDGLDRAMRAWRPRPRG